MMLSFMVVVVCASLACSLGKPAADMPASRCYPPDEMEGRLVHVGDDKDVNLMKFYVDDNQKAMRFTGKGWDTYLRWNEGVQYIVAGQKCYRHKLDPSSYEPMGVSDHFNLLTDGRLGGEMPVELYGAAANGSGALLAVSKKTCAPAYVIAKHNNQTTVSNFLDVRTCVSAGALDVPAICRMNPSGGLKRTILFHDVPFTVKRGLQWHHGRK